MFCSLEQRDEYICYLFYKKKSEILLKRVCELDVQKIKRNTAQVIQIQILNNLELFIGFSMLLRNRRLRSIFFVIK